MSDFHDEFAAYAADVATDAMSKTITYQQDEADDVQLQALVSHIESDLKLDGEGAKNRTERVRVSINLSTTAFGGGIAEPREKHRVIIDEEPYIVTAVMRKGTSRATLVCERHRKSRHGRAGAGII